jgi:hypothetical protein
MPLTARGYDYPASTDAPRVWEDMQALAASIDADVQLLEDRMKPLAEVSFAASSSAIGTSEIAHINLPSATYKAGRCYEIVVKGAYNMNTSAAYPSLFLRKTNVAGALILDFGPRLVSPAAATGLGFGLHISEFLCVGGSDVTASLALTVQASAGTVTIVGNSQHPRRAIAYDRGPASAYTNLPVLS